MFFHRLSDFLQAMDYSALSKVDPEELRQLQKAPTQKRSKFEETHSYGLFYCGYSTVTVTKGCSTLFTVGFTQLHPPTEETHFTS